MIPLAIIDDDDDFEDEVCGCCGQPAVGYYADRPDCPTCGKVSCEQVIQQTIDYRDYTRD